MKRLRTMPVTNTHDPAVDEIRRALGAELRRAREKRGWSRAQLAASMPSGIGERTLRSYESGTRAFTVLRLIELCQALGIPVGGLVSMAVQRARIHLENLVLLVDLPGLLNDDTDRFRPLHQCAKQNA